MTIYKYQAFPKKFLCHNPKFRKIINLNYEVKIEVKIFVLNIFS